MYKETRSEQMVCVKVGQQTVLDISCNSLQFESLQVHVLQFHKWFTYNTCTYMDALFLLVGFLYFLNIINEVIEAICGYVYM